MKNKGAIFSWSQLNIFFYYNIKLLRNRSNKFNMLSFKFLGCLFEYEMYYSSLPFSLLHQFIYLFSFLRWFWFMFSYLIQNCKLKFKFYLIVPWDFSTILAIYPERKKHMGHGHVFFQGFLSLGVLILLSIAEFLFRWFIGKIYIGKKKRRIKNEGNYLLLINPLRIW